MATFRLPAIILSQTFNEDGDTLTNRQINNQTLIVETSADDGFFQYRLDPDDPSDPTPLQPASLSGGNVTALELNGQRAVGAELDDLDLFVNRVRASASTLKTSPGRISRRRRSRWGRAPCLAWKARTTSKARPAPMGSTALAATI